MPRIRATDSGPIDFCRPCFPDEDTAVELYMGSRIRWASDSDTPLYRVGFGVYLPLDHATIYTPEERQRVKLAPGESWEGVCGEGPDGRGDCSGYDEPHPNYFEMDYRCHSCGKLLGNSAADLETKRERETHD